VCIEYDGGRGAPASSPGRYSADPRQSRDALRLLCAHTLARPAGPRSLFVEGYFMRTLLAAHAISDSLPGEVPTWFDSHAGLERARAFADQLVATQDAHGYWPLGYGAVYIADMGAALGLLPALEPHVEPERAATYEAAARRFAQALERDGMILPSGALGVGWWGTTVPRIERRASREPYVVSTALAGVELHAWLHRRSKSAADRERALRALDWTLSRIQTDGSLEPGPKIPAVSAESPLVSAVYAQEGWMAADVLLGDPETLARLRRALPPHVTWLLRLQRPDGRWDEGGDGEFARTPAIADFLVWYDQRCEARDDVRDAVRRAGAWLVDPSHARELYRAGNHYEVLRAIGGRTLAALGQERFAL
jgi:hypothetical protein